MASIELRKRSAELLHTSQEVALTSPDTVSKLRAHDLYCNLLRMPSNGVYRVNRRASILDEGLAASLGRCEISDRILSCQEPPPMALVDLRETTLGEISPSEPLVGSCEAAGGMSLLPSQAAEPTEETTEDES